MKMEVKIDLDELTWSTDTHTLEEIVKKFKTDMPDYLKVNEAYYLHEDEFYCDRGDYFKVHGIREELVYRAIAVTTFGLEIRSTPVHIPLRYKGKVKLVPPNAFGKVYKGLKSVARDLPRFIQVVELPDYGCVTELFSLENDDVLELLQINEPAMKGVPRTMTFQKVDEVDFSKKIGHQFKLPVTSMGKFEYLIDFNEYTVMQIEEMQESLPGEKHVKFIRHGNAGVQNVFHGEFILQNTFLKRELVCTEVTNTVESIDLLKQQEDPRMRYRPEGERKERLQLFVVDDKEMNATFNYTHLPKEAGNSRIDVECLKRFIYFKMSPVNQYIPDHDYSYVRNFRASHPEQQEGDDYELINDANEPNESEDYDDVEPQNPFHHQQAKPVPEEDYDEDDNYETINDEDLENCGVPPRPPKFSGVGAVGVSSRKEKKRLPPCPVDTSQGKLDVVTSRLEKTNMSSFRRLPPPVPDVSVDDTEISMPRETPPVLPRSPRTVKEGPDLPPVPQKCPKLRKSIELEKEHSMRLDEPSITSGPVTVKLPVSLPGVQGDRLKNDSISNVKLNKVPPTPRKQIGHDSTSKMTRTASGENLMSPPAVFNKPKTNNLFLSELASKIPKNTAKMMEKADEPAPVAKPRLSKLRKSNVPTATIRPIGSVTPEDTQPTPQVGPHLLRPRKSSVTSVTTPKPFKATKPFGDPPASEKVETNNSASLDSPIEDDLCKSTSRLSISFGKFEDIPVDVTGLTVKQLGEVLAIYGLAKVEELFRQFHIDGEFFMTEMSKEDLEEEPFNLKGFALARVMTIKSKKKPM